MFELSLFAMDSSTDATNKELATSAIPLNELSKNESVVQIIDGAFYFVCPVCNHSASSTSRSGASGLHRTHSPEDCVRFQKSPQSETPEPIIMHPTWDF